jgi:pimeloyl-ACP methyl ester carboxylesterase
MKAASLAGEAGEFEGSEMTPKKKNSTSLEKGTGQGADRQNVALTEELPTSEQVARRAHELYLERGCGPGGVDSGVFEGIQKAVASDRYAFFTDFFKNFFNTDIFMGKRISEQAVQANWNVAAAASATASLACVPTWHEDFRNDLARLDVPTLVIHGDADRIVPFRASGEQTAKLVKGARLVAIKDGPHTVNWTHAEEVNAELVNFLGRSGAKQAARSAR